MNTILGEVTSPGSVKYALDQHLVGWKSGLHCCVSVQLLKGVLRRRRSQRRREEELSELLIIGRRRH